jgi:RNA recognition motif-containing protein
MSARSTIYIGNMPYTATDEELRRLVEPRKVVRITIPTDKETQRPRGFGFIEFANDEDAESAVEALDGTNFGGRAIKVNIAKPQSENRRRDRS